MTDDVTTSPTFEGFEEEARKFSAHDGIYHVSMQNLEYISQFRSGAMDAKLGDAVPPTKPLDIILHIAAGTRLPPLADAARFWSHPCVGNGLWTWNVYSNKFRPAAKFDAVQLHACALRLSGLPEVGSVQLISDEDGPKTAYASYRDGDTDDEDFVPRKGRNCSAIVHMRRSAVGDQSGAYGELGRLVRLLAGLID